ncbi:MAG TPA: prephenate dehydrogenase/arogenate dehydrogenase family protein [Dehalococcoidia bacterium]|nr:prephenate dehydrogenase/arogenate dehydrogenase family protein [Dehalococcoidia bacterium]
MPRVAIIGTGLIGASIGLAMRQRSQIKDLEIVGYDREAANGKRAQKIGAIDSAARSPREAVRDASMVVMATPVLTLRKIMAEIAPALDEGAVITDTGSTKTDVMAWAAQELPDTVSFVGGHPMAGKTESGPEHASVDLFDGARWAIVPARDASEGALKTIRAMAETAGAKEIFMDAEEHDAYVAAISHLPMMAATAMFNMTHESEAWPEMSLLAAGGFKDTTRLTDTDPDMSFDIAVTNRTQIIHWIERYRESLRELQDRLSDEEGEEELYRYMAQANWDYAGFRAGVIGREEVDQKNSQVPKSDFSSLLMGEAIAGKMRELTEASEERLKELERTQRLKRGE